MRNINKNGHIIVVDDTTQHAFWNNYENNEWEPFTFKILDNFLCQEDNYLDLGAWIGPTALYASYLCNKCFAVEPDIVAFNELLTNIDLTQQQNIVAYNCAIFNYNGLLQLGNDSGLGNSVTRLGQSQNLFEVECFKLSSFVNQYALDNIRFIKMDVEGCEEFILEDLEFFSMLKPVLYVSLHDFWFVDKASAVEKIKTIGKLYKNSYDVFLNKIDLDSLNYGVIFSD